MEITAHLTCQGALVRLLKLFVVLSASHVTFRPEEKGRGWWDAPDFAVGCLFVLPANCTVDLYTKGLHFYANTITMTQFSCTFSVSKSLQLISY